MIRPTWRMAWREHLPAAVALAVAIVAWVLLDLSLGPRFELQLGYAPSFYWFLHLLWVPLPFAMAGARLSIRDADGRLALGRDAWHQAWALYRAEYLNRVRLGAAVLFAVLVALTLNGFGSWKRAIPSVRPFSWDASLHGFDRTLHLGTLPWEWLQPALGHVPVTVALDILYYLWFPCLGLVIAWLAWTRHREVRARFLLSFVLCWVLLGNLAATILSSAGPPYYDRVALGGGQPYAPLLTYLATADSSWRVLAVHVQAALWQGMLDGTATPYTGISAMPSLHVAMPTLYLLAARHVSRLVAACFAGYLAVVLVASVHLGWHYAVDGYASLIAVPAIWWIAGKVLPGDPRDQRGDRRRADTSPTTV